MDTELGDSIATNSDTAPTFPGGVDEFYKFVQRETKYPLLAKVAGMEGRVYIKCVITKYGEVAVPKVISGIGYGCNEEAIRVIKSMPLWTPAKQSGIPVNVRIQVPIYFKLSK